MALKDDKGDQFSFKVIFCYEVRSHVEHVFFFILWHWYIDISFDNDVTFISQWALVSTSNLSLKTLLYGQPQYCDLYVKYKCTIILHQIQLKIYKKIFPVSRLTKGASISLYNSLTIPWSDYILFCLCARVCVCVRGVRVCVRACVCVRVREFSEHGERVWVVYLYAIHIFFIYFPKFQQICFCQSRYVVQNSSLVYIIITLTHSAGQVFTHRDILWTILL